MVRWEQQTLSSFVGKVRRYNQLNIGIIWKEESIKLAQENRKSDCLLRNQFGGNVDPSITFRAHIPLLFLW